MARRPILPPRRGTLTGGKKLTIDYERAEEHFTPYHNWTRQMLLDSLRRLRQELQQAEDDGRDSKAKKIRREINSVQEAELALPTTWCPTCLRTLQLCRCPKDPTVSRSTNRRRKLKERAAADHIQDILGSRWVREGRED